MYKGPLTIPENLENKWFCVLEKTGEILFCADTLEVLDNLAESRKLYETTDYHKHKKEDKKPEKKTEQISMTLSP